MRGAALSVEAMTESMFLNLPVQLPNKLINSLQNIPGFDEEAFRKAHESVEQVTSIRINPAKKFKIQKLQSKIPWSELGYYLDTRPSFTFDPLFHAGCYYVQEASSMFLEQAVKQIVDLSEPLKILDLSAAPGGKTTHIQSLISKNSLLVSNEVIRARANILKDNIIKWGCENVFVTNNDPADFSQLENYFDVVVVDAPCSGSGLFRKDADAIAEWSLNNVQLCSQRQQRILADVLPCLKKDGLLIYSTCSYSSEEDEDVVDWMTAELPLKNLRLAVEENWGVVEVKTPAQNHCYRFWPYMLKGEGFFSACFSKTEGGIQPAIKPKRNIEPASKKEMSIICNRIKDEGFQLLKFAETFYALPEKLVAELNLLQQYLRIIYCGVETGQVMKEKLVPAHALALSNLPNADVERTELNYEQAIQFLQKKELPITLFKKGWQIATHKNFGLGWVNALANRVNNYYPKELRILKDI